MKIDPVYDFVVRNPHKAAEELKTLRAELEAAIDWHWNESVPGTTRQEIVDNIKLLAEK